MNANEFNTCPEEQATTKQKVAKADKLQTWALQEAQSLALLIIAACLHN